MIDLRIPAALPPRAVSPEALREVTGQANCFEMTPIGRKVVDGEVEAEEKGKNDLKVAVAASAPSSSSTAAAAAPIEQRRLEAQRHRHTEVWTKEPHGGRHRPAGPSSKGLDPLTHDPASGALLSSPPLGFEKPLKTGPTTNFVGDAMLGAPMALIGAKLAAADAKASSSVALLCSSSSSSTKPLLPLAAPAKKLPPLLEEQEFKKALSDSPLVVERYDFSKAREFAARLLGRKLPKTGERERQNGVEGS